MFRLKSKYYTGLTKDRTGKWKPMDDDPVLPGCNEYEVRKTLKQQYDNHEISEQQYRDERSKVLKYMPNPPPVLKMELHHGNILVMSGEGIQKYYEVSSFHFISYSSIN